MKKKLNLPVDKIRKYLEPGPIVLVSSKWKGKNNIMTMGWHTVMEFSPSLIGCVIAASNHSFEMIKKSGECVINIPTVDMIDQVIKVGNSTGADIDKFEAFGLTAGKSRLVDAPLIEECYANFECRVVDKRMVPKYNFFILEVVRAQVMSTPKYPTTVHYRGDALFMISGKNTSFPKNFKKQNL